MYCCKYVGDVRCQGASDPPNLWIHHKNDEPPACHHVRPVSVGYTRTNIQRTTAATTTTTTKKRHSVLQQQGYTCTIRYFPCRVLLCVATTHTWRHISSPATHSATSYICGWLLGTRTRLDIAAITQLGAGEVLQACVTAEPRNTPVR